ncbi:MAG: hypothetical protein F6K17_08745, partial [Okeania sp. SIO3C4]|nr:hypothetical protein [Okeania sp. SIO3C4]
LKKGRGRRQKAEGKIADGRGIGILPVLPVLHPILCLFCTQFCTDVACKEQGMLGTGARCSHCREIGILPVLPVLHPILYLFCPILYGRCMQGTRDAWHGSKMLPLPWNRHLACSACSAPNSVRTLHARNKRCLAREQDAPTAVCGIGILPVLSVLPNSVPVVPNSVRTLHARNKRCLAREQDAPTAVCGIGILPVLSVLPNSVPVVPNSVRTLHARNKGCLAREQDAPTAVRGIGILPVLSVLPNSVPVVPNSVRTLHATSLLPYSPT